jgi:hypothetical protein
MIYPAAHDLTIEQRARFERRFAFLGPDGVAYDLTGYSFEAAVWTESHRKLCDLTFAWVSQTDGTFTLSLTPEVTEPLRGVGVWDLLGTDPSGHLDYWLRGRVRIEPGQTTGA